MAGRGEAVSFILAVLPFVPWIVVFLWLISLSGRVGRMESSGKPRPISDTYTRKRGPY